MRGASIAVDTLTALTESGDLSEPLARGVIAKDDISLLGELIAAKSVPPRPHKTVFKAVGVAHADLAVAEQLVDRDRQWV
jgi:ornithine cyclodeaminase